MSQHTLPRHSTLIFWPGSILLMSTSTGAPAALARSLGQNDITNGAAAATAPMPPTTDVAPIRKRRLSLFDYRFESPIPAFRCRFHEVPRPAKPSNYTGIRCTQLKRPAAA